MSDTNEPWKWGDESQPKPEPQSKILGQRHLCCGYDAEMRPFGQGDWVAYRDYKEVEDLLRIYIERDALRRAGESIHQHRVDSGTCNREKNELIAKLKEEIEKLKKQISETVPFQMTVSAQEMAIYLEKYRPVFHKQINDQEEEISRLKKEVKDAWDCSRHYCELWKKEKIEVERLRQKLPSDDDINRGGYNP